MKENVYEGIIYSRIEPKFDKAILIAAIMTWIAVIVIYFSDIPRVFIFVDSAIALVLSVISYYKNRVKMIVKVYIAVAFPALVGMMSFYQGGFSTSGVTLILLANLIAVVFLNRMKSILMAALSSAYFLFIWGWSQYTGAASFLAISSTLWMTLFVVFMLFLVMLQVMIYAIKDYMMNIIMDLEDSGKKLSHLAYYNQMTGLPNDIYLKEQLEDRVRKKGFLVFINFHNLGLIRSIFNETIGDLVLTESARVIQSLNSDEVILSHVGSEDFVLWICDITEEKLIQQLQLIKSNLYVPVNIPGLKKSIEIAISYAFCDMVHDQFDDCYQKVKIAMTYAKRNNHSEIIGYNKELELLVRYEENLVELLKIAISKDEFVLHYQTKIDTKTERVIGVEALARWNSPVLGIVGPATFLPVVKRIGFSGAFGRLVIRKALGDFAQIQQKYGEEISLAINVAPDYFLDSGFIDFVSEVAQKNKVAPARVIFEITEDMMIEDIDYINGVLEAIQSLGFHTSIDDFGSGYSAYYYLVNLKVDELKIDQLFIAQIETNQRYVRILNSIIALAKDLQLNVVAEGVETKAQYELLKEYGCPSLQGYYFSKPEPL